MDTSQAAPFIQFLIAIAIAWGSIYIGRLLSKGGSQGNLNKTRGKDSYPASFELPGALPEQELSTSVEEYFNHPAFSASQASQSYLSQSLNMIETHNLSKTFISKKKGKRSVVEAVKQINFSVARGEIFGLLGPNGAGKTTTMRMLATLVTPTRGTAAISGWDLSAHPKEIRRDIGYVSQVGGMQRETTGRENLLLQAKLYGMSNFEAKARVEELLTLLDLRAFADRKTGTYSGGQRRIFDLASGIVHKPKLLFLDEPSTGLDPQNRAHVWEQVKKMHDEGTTIFVTTHYLEEADALCDRVAIVDEGTIVAIGTPEELKRQIAGDIISLEFETPLLAEEVLALLGSSAFIVETKKENTSVHLYVDKGNENLPMIMSTLHKKGIISTSVALSRPTLDDVFLKLTGHSIRENQQ
ncbi:MAG: ATP-binding cassette domain-containing protein [Patescibacteria group bacterium]